MFGGALLEHPPRSSALSLAAKEASLKDGVLTMSTRERRAIQQVSARRVLRFCILFFLSSSLLFASAAPRRFPIALQRNEVIPTGNEWIALPNIRAGDGALTSFLEEFSVPHSARELEMMLDRDGAEVVIAGAAAWCNEHTRTTGQPDLDMLMNRNFFFTALYAWGGTIDAEQFVGVTSRSPRDVS